MNQFTINITEKGRVIRHGIYTPKGTEVVARTDDTLIVKIPGHSYWAALHGVRVHAPVEYAVWLILEDRGEGCYRVERVRSYGAQEYREARKAGLVGGQA